MSDQPETPDAELGMEYNGAEGHETDTVASIIAEMRDTWTDTPPSALSDLADRIDAAAERERNAHTNDIHDALYKATGAPRQRRRDARGADRVRRFHAMALRRRRARHIQKAIRATSVRSPRRTRLAREELRPAGCADVESAWATYCAETNRADCKGFARWLFDKTEGGDHA